MTNVKQNCIETYL